MEIEIREARMENAAEIACLTAQLGYLAHETKTREWLDYLLCSKTHCVLVAINNAKYVCGWIVIEKRISLEAGFKAEITGFVVGENYRRMGIGQGLVSAAIDWAQKSNLSRLVVRSNIQREESHAFYKRIGFALKKSAHCYELSL